MKYERRPANDPSHHRYPYSFSSSIRACSVVDTSTHPPGGHDVLATAGVQDTEPEQVSAAEQEPTCCRRVAERRRRPLRTFDPERREQPSLHECRPRFAQRALEHHTERDDARGAVAERTSVRRVLGLVSQLGKPRIGRSNVNCTQSSTGYMRSSLPAENVFQSSHSRHELIVRRSSTVISSLRGSGLSGPRRSEKNGRTRAPTPSIAPASIASPTSMPVTVFVAERVFRSPPAPTLSKYCS